MNTMSRIVRSDGESQGHSEVGSYSRVRLDTVLLTEQFNMTPSPTKSQNLQKYWKIYKFTILANFENFTRVFFRFEISETKNKFRENLFHRPRRLRQEAIRPWRRTWNDEKWRRTSDINLSTSRNGVLKWFWVKLRSLRSRSPNALCWLRK